MPIDYRRYADDWPVIRAAILNRADHCCEWCGVPNYAVGYRMPPDGRFEHVASTGDAQVADGGTPVTIILTVAHLDHNPDNNDPDNLRALCQRCHLRYDVKQHARTAAITRRQRRIDAGQGVLL